jgi:hypothetical protein
VYISESISACINAFFISNCIINHPLLMAIISNKCHVSVLHVVENVSRKLIPSF